MERLLKACKRLHDYSYFMKEVNTRLDKGYELDEAISAAMDYCIENDILADILLNCKSEVFNMLLTEYDEKKHLKHVREEGKEEGREEGIRALIETCQDIGVSFEETAYRVKSKIVISEEKVQEYMKKYWK